MFVKLINSGWIDEWVEEARTESREEDKREEHKILHDTILDFFSSRQDWVIDDPELLTTDEHTMRIFSIYVDDAARVSNKLANIIVVKYPFIVLRTIEPKYHFILSINGQDVANIRDLSKLMNIKYLNPVIRDYPSTGTKQWKIPVLPPDVYLLELYHKRYNPSFHEEWDDIDRQITTMIELLNKHITGGGSYKETPVQKGVNYIRRQLLDKLKGSNDIIVCGQYVINILQKRLETIIPAMQILSRIHINDFLNKLKEWFEVDGRFILTLINQNLRAPFDFRLKKFTVYLKVAGEQRPLLDVFTSLQYEQIPYFIHEDIKFAHPLVVQRFVYLDIWILRVMLQEGKVDKAKLEQIMRKKSELAAIVKKFDMPMNTWLGEWTNENTDYKIMALKKREGSDIPTYPYKPYIYFIKHDKYRLF